MLPPRVVPLSSEFGTHKTVKARFWPWLPGKSLYFFQVIASSLGSCNGSTRGTRTCHGTRNGGRMGAGRSRAGRSSVLPPTFIVDCSSRSLSLATTFLAFFSFHLSRVCFFSWTMGPDPRTTKGLSRVIPAPFLEPVSRPWSHFQLIRGEISWGMVHLFRLPN